MTTCKDLRDLLPVHAADGASVEEALAVEEHASRCESCRAGLEEYRRLCGTVRRELAALPPEPAGFPSETSSMKGGRSRMAPTGGFGLAAAAALIIFGIFVGRWTAPPGPPPEGGEAIARLTGPVRALGLQGRTERYRSLLSRFPGTSGKLPEWRIERTLQGRPTLSVFSPTARLYFRQAPER